MRKILLIVAVVLVALVGGFFWFNNYIYQEKQGPTDYKDATYIIDGTPVTLVDGVAETEAALDSTSSPQAGSASKVVTRFFGNQAKGDLNKDGIPDLAFLLTQESGGSGTFYYLVAAIQTPANTYNGSQAVFLGDRIAPQTTEIRDGKVIVNYADRAVGEPMTTPPSVGKSIVLLLDPESLQFGQVAQDFEGEADPSRMTLDMKPWVWISTLYNDEREVTPKKAGAFTLTFGDGRFSAKTDCNSVAGSYKAEGGLISFTEMMSTLMYCDGSQESEFTQMLGNASGYHFTSKGELILDLKFDSGTATFR